jgi:phosphopantothenoylcysteine decarboxylase/phosphopantothenate--cysteine ligase
MSTILVTSGPTRQYLDPVRFISNASSGQMGYHIVDAAIRAGHDVIVVSGPVALEYPQAARVVPVTTTEEMLDACLEAFPQCDGVIGVAAPCDYRPVTVSSQKIRKTGQPFMLQLVQTPDVVATLGAGKRPDQWVVGFALETEDAHFQAVAKLHRKCCDLVVLNGPQAIDSPNNSVEIIDPSGQVIAAFSGPKRSVGRAIFLEIQQRLISSRLAVAWGTDRRQTE